VTHLHICIMYSTFIHSRESNFILYSVLYVFTPMEFSILHCEFLQCKNTFMIFLKNLDWRELQNISKICRRLVGSLIYSTIMKTYIVHLISLVSKFKNESSKLNFILFSMKERIVHYFLGTKKLRVK